MAVSACVTDIEKAKCHVMKVQSIVHLVTKVVKTELNVEDHEATAMTFVDDSAQSQSEKNSLGPF